MQRRTIYNGKGERVMQEMRIEIHGKGGAQGIECVKNLMGLLEQLKAQKTPKDVQEHLMLCMGYCICCKDSGYIDEKAADDIMQLACTLAAIETEWAEKDQKGRAGE